MIKFKVMVSVTNEGVATLMPMMDGGMLYDSDGNPVILNARGAVRWCEVLMRSVNEWWELVASGDVDADDDESDGDSDDDVDDDEENEDAEGDSDSADDIEDVVAEL